MNLFSSVYQYFLYTFLIYHEFNVLNASSIHTILSTVPHEVSTTEVLAETTAPKATVAAELMALVTTVEGEATLPPVIIGSASTVETIELGSSSNSIIVPVVQPSTQKHQSSDPVQPTIVSSTHHHSRITQLTNKPVTQKTNSPINSTEMVQVIKSRVSVIMGFIFGGSAIIVIIACIIIYILIQKGYIKIFNRSGTRVKDVERTRIYSSSSSTNSGASPRK
ncbi:unnamed protein product [Adineta steineri]|uniref:Uncharacterized protein n=1 Tax=Adineta steineri TaxID=433720 RepID=A0A814RH93_9BILA|nr:unnamed protein product [Adineta steineri]CAF1133191.1 unnamed protein product [Adineta steineri]CAF1205789.1 unnamed protein product [Adineta steineri]